MTKFFALRRGGQLKRLASITVLFSAASSASEYLPFTGYLPPLSFSAEEYESGYNDYCRDDVGHINTYRCVDKVIREMTHRYDDFHDTCDHRGVFGLVYLMTTQEYQRASLEPGFFQDPEFVNHEDVIFAKLYNSAADNWSGGRLEFVPPAWRVAFETSRDRSVSTTGDMLLGISAHINRDLPIALATIGLVDPATGLSRKPDHDKVNTFLARVEPDPAIQQSWDADYSSGSSTPHLSLATMSLIQTWREAAWRWAEQLVAAPTAAEQAIVLMGIERYAYEQAMAIKTATQYTVLENSGDRDVYCAVNN